MNESDATVNSVSGLSAGGVDADPQKLRNRNCCGMAPSPYWLLISLCMFWSVQAAVFPWLPDLKVDFFGGSYSKASFYSGVFDSTAALISFFTYPLVGAASDVYGRKPMLFVCNLLVSMPTFALASDISFWFYLGAKLIAGVNGMVSVSYGYLADSVPAAERSKYFGRAVSCIALGFIIGPTACLFVPRDIIFRVCAAVCALNSVWICFMPESLGYNRTVNSQTVTAATAPAASEAPVAGVNVVVVNPAPEAAAIAAASGADIPLAASAADDGADAEIEGHKLNPCTSLRYAFKSRYFTLVAMCSFFYKMSQNGVDEIALLYIKKRLSFSNADMDYMLIWMGTTAFLFLNFVFPHLTRGSVKPMAIFGLIINIAHVIAYIVIQQHWQVYIIMTLALGAYIIDPPLQTMVSKHVCKADQGLAAGALAGVNGITEGGGPLIFSLIFSYFTSSESPIYFPEMAFCFGLACLAVSFVIALYLPAEPPKLKSLRDSPPPAASGKADDGSAPLLVHASDH